MAMFRHRGRVKPRTRKSWGKEGRIYSTRLHFWRMHTQPCQHTRVRRCRRSCHYHDDCTLEKKSNKLDCLVNLLSELSASNMLLPCFAVTWISLDVQYVLTSSPPDQSSSSSSSSSFYNPRFNCLQKQGHRIVQHHLTCPFFSLFEINFFKK